MPMLISTNSGRFKCSACDQFFSPPPVARGARPWTSDEIPVKLAAEFREHVEKVHLSPRPDAVKDTETIPANETH